MSVEESGTIITSKYSVKTISFRLRKQQKVDRQLMPKSKYEYLTVTSKEI